MSSQAAIPSPHAIDSRHGYAILLVVIGSTAISFGGLVLRNNEYIGGQITRDSD